MDQRKKNRRILIGFLFVFVGMVVYSYFRYGPHAGTAKSVNTTSAWTTTTSIPHEVIRYEILRKWTPGKAGTGMEILVSPDATKQEVLTLADDLVATYRQYGQVVISIFDSKEAWANRENDNYPEAKYWPHFLVSIFVPKVNDSEVTWVAKGRIEPKKRK